MREIKDIHLPFRAYLDKESIPYHYNRPDKHSTAHKGDPDFLLTHCNRCLYLEAKTPVGKLSLDQEKRIAYLRAAGNKVLVVRSLEEAVEAVIVWLGVVNSNSETPITQDDNTPRGQAKFDVFATKVILDGIGSEVPTGQAPVDEHYRIAIWHNADYVFDIEDGSEYSKLVRRATPDDLVRYKRL